RSQPFHVGAVLVRVALDRHLALLVRDKPRPAASELAQRCLLELLLESVVTPERALDRFAEPAWRVAAAARAHDAPEDRVVRVAARVVANRFADVLRDGVDAP